MAEPVGPSLAAAAIAAAPVAGLTLFGVPLGLQAPDLVAGLIGAAVAVLLFNAVPSTGDTAREFLRTSFKRASFILLSAAVAGYAAPAGGPALAKLATLWVDPAALGEMTGPLRRIAALLAGMLLQQGWKLASGWLISKTAQPPAQGGA